MAQSAPPPRPRLVLVPPPSPLKSHDSVVAVLFSGRVARLLLPAAEASGLSPNQVTLLSLVSTLVAVPLISFGGPAGWLIAALLVQVGFIGDCLDGQLARATGKVSDFGRYLDSLTDLVKVFALISAMTLSLVRHGGGPPACALGALAFFGYLLCEYHVQLVRALPQRTQEDYERHAASWKARLAIGGQRIDVAFAIGEVLLTITLALAFARIRAGLVTLAIVTPVQFASYAVRFWKHRYSP
jgi:archaetidylinositol phosphate synthase